MLGRKGMGSFFRRFVIFAPPELIQRFLQHKATAKLLAQVVPAHRGRGLGGLGAPKAPPAAGGGGQELPSARRGALGRSEPPSLTL